MMKLNPRSPLDLDIIKLTGRLLVFLHFIYALIFYYVIPQRFESCHWRLSYILVSIPLIAVDYWPKALHRLLILYWHICLIYSITFASAYLTLRNDFSTLWMMSDTIVLFTLNVLIDSLKLLAINLLVGVLLAIACHSYVTNEVIIINDVGTFFMLPGIFASIILANISKKNGLSALEKNSALKSLAGSIAHEMRNPLAQIHNNLYLIEELQKQQDYSGHTSPIVEEHIDHARKIVHSGLQLIDITMDAIRENPVDPLSFKLLSSRQLVEETVDDYAYEEAAHAQLVSVKGGDFWFMGDLVMFKYILYNLIQNAIWFVKTIPDATISITIIPNADGISTIEVLDTGPGIAGELLPQVFDSFFTEGKIGGTGLGLSYCKRTMKAFGGDICCRSVLGEYTVFTLSFPRLSAQDAMSIDKKLTLS
jgi:signal transduction histidine kinase